MTKMLKNKYLLVLGFLCGTFAVTQLRAAEPITMRVIGADHPSCIYYPRDEAKFEILAQNVTDSPQTLAGKIELVALTPDADKPYEVLSTTPIVETTLPARQAVKMSIPGVFGKPGRHELRWSGKKIDLPAGLELESIFPPRKSEVTRWVSHLPDAVAIVPGFLADYVAQTGVNPFVYDLEFPGNARAQEQEFSNIIKQVSAAKAQVILNLRIKDGVSVQQAVSLHNLLVMLLNHADVAALRGAVLNPSKHATQNAEYYRAFYLAVYDTLKRKDKGILMMGAGSAQATAALLLKNNDKDTDLRPYIDAVISSGAPADVALARQIVGPEGSVAVLPDAEARMPSAILLGQGVNIVPVVEHDKGVIEQLLGGAALFERMHPGYHPYVGVFQGDGYSVAAIAGPGAGTPEDLEWANLPSVPGAVMEVADENFEMRLVDEAGQPVNARIGDVWKIPLDGKIRYLLQGGSSEEQAALLRTAATDKLPIVDVQVLELIAPQDDKRFGALRIKISNARPYEVSGTLKIYDAKNTLLATRSFIPISAGKWVESQIPLEKILVDNTVVVEISSRFSTYKQRLKIPETKN